MAPLILHNVPDDECYVGDDGVKRPYAMIFNQYESYHHPSSPIWRAKLTGSPDQTHTQELPDRGEILASLAPSENRHVDPDHAPAHQRNAAARTKL